MANRVKFIPAQMDAHAGSTTAKAWRENPGFGLLRDVGVLTGKLKYLPLIVSPFRTTDEYAEFYMWSWVNIRDAILQILLAIIQAFMMLFVPVAVFASMLFLPGGLLVAMIAVCWGLVYVISLPMKGPRIVQEQPPVETGQHPDERWLFINGCLTGYDHLLPIWRLHSDIS